MAALKCCGKPVLPPAHGIDDSTDWQEQTPRDARHGQTLYRPGVNPTYNRSMDSGQREAAFLTLWFLRSAVAGILENRWDFALIRGLARIADGRQFVTVSRDAWRRAVESVIEGAIPRPGWTHSSLPREEPERFDACRVGLLSESALEILFPEWDAPVVAGTWVKTAGAKGVFREIQSRLETAIEWSKLPPRLLQRLQRDLVSQVDTELVAAIQQAGKPEGVPTDDFVSRLLAESGLMGDATDEIRTILRRQSGPAQRIPPRASRPRTPFFTGHDDEYATLVAALDRGDASLVQSKTHPGAGGLGKTQLALRYAAEHEANYPGGILWLRSDIDLWIRTSVLDEAYRCAPDLVSLDDANVTIDRFCAWLVGRGNFLVVFDGADRAGVTDFLRKKLRCGSARFLYTSRQPGSAFPSPILVKTLPPETGARLLLRRAGRLDENEKDVSSHPEFADARRLSIELAGIALAIDQAGAYMNHVSVTSAEYRDLFLRERTKYRAARAADPGGQPDASAFFVAITVRIALTYLENDQKPDENGEILGPVAADLTRLFAFLDHDHIRVEWLTTAAMATGYWVALSENMRDAIGSPSHCLRVLKRAASLALIVVCPPKSVPRAT